jgi:L-iditol 2-dehydrogenase
MTYDELGALKFDVVLEAVGSPDAIARSIECTCPGGTLVLMGNPSGDINLPQSVYWQILRKQLTVKGTWNSSYDGVNKSDWTEAVETLGNNGINVQPLISHLFKQADLTKGLELMRGHTEPYCKVMTTWNDID